MVVMANSAEVFFFMVYLKILSTGSVDVKKLLFLIGTKHLNGGRIGMRKFCTNPADTVPVPVGPDTGTTGTGSPTMVK
jgi:hypothetical protein